MLDKLTIFFSNPKVSRERLITPHYAQTIERIRASDAKYILAIQDQMRLNYTKHLAKNGLGSIGKVGKTEQYGLIQHSILCVTEQNVPLGLMDVEFFDYDEFNTSIGRDKRSLEDKANIHWLRAIRAMRNRLGDVKQHIITVADREGDFYEFLHHLLDAKEEFIIRAQHDRYTGKTYKNHDEKLWTVLHQAEIKGTMAVEIQDVNSREMQTIQLNLKAVTVTLPIPKKITAAQIIDNNYTAITVNVVMAYNDEHEWVLLTSLPIRTVDDIKEVVILYRCRWHIEDYHKVLKTGYQVDEIYLHSSRQAIENLLVMASISACRLYWMIYVGRSEQNIKADQVFDEFEWKAVYVYFKEKIPKECPPLSEVILKIARLGGYKQSKTGSKPGIKTMWTGFQHFTIAAQMYRNMSIET